MSSFPCDLEEALRRNRERFFERFGRKPGPEDPILWDGELDTPRRITSEALEQMAKAAMRKAAVPPELISALCLADDPLESLGFSARGEDDGACCRKQLGDDSLPDSTAGSTRH
jgi:hypothetical protein